MTWQARHTQPPRSNLWDPKVARFLVGRTSKRVCGGVGGGGWWLGVGGCRLLALLATRE